MVRSCATVVLAYIFQCRSVTVAYVSTDNVMVYDEAGIVLKLVRRKAQPTAWPPLLTYPQRSTCDSGTGPPTLISRGDSMRPGCVGYFILFAGDTLCK